MVAWLSAHQDLLALAGVSSVVLNSYHLCRHLPIVEQVVVARCCCLCGVDRREDVFIIDGEPGFALLVTVLGAGQSVATE